ncbi:low specificity L-threonine aldolase [Mucilaginibacter sp. BT774]|uniref:threonine aldolase family protein n=1 Tax=Mucilaginibacter sp. BT774 TaxID=3062276 RepID=UPI00267656A6|nr:aminotransferase class I/II-fold pyridoxal phosphate-dependent enzyme [Mucilaginibacter sp. BT774]MDO3627750.1 aminotransferase class I/II-fold pyridoxal phosphate-dependent enzyme [Mucilaginibacter sp. BT774]
MINFASENYAGVQADMMQALTDANKGNAASYGNDAVTAETTGLLKDILGSDIEVYFTFNGTGANNFGLGSVTERYNSIFCADVAHLYVDESTAPESFIGCRIYTIPSESGKITAESLRSAIIRAGDIHHPQPKVVSLTQPTEYGTVYTLDELKSIKSVCTENNMLLHVDGARFFNAAVYLNASLKQMTEHIDILTLGGTKAGMMFGEAVIFFHIKSSSSYKYHLKRSMQLASKNRFIAAQFQAMLKNGLWQKLARHTNDLAKRFEQEVGSIPGIAIAHPVQTNSVFLTMSPSLYEKMHQHFHFYYWNDLKSEVRLVFSFDNTEKEIADFATLLAEYTKG